MGIYLNPEMRASEQQSARRFMWIRYPSEAKAADERANALLEARPALAIKEWGADFVEADPQQIGLAGSPTKVKTVENVVFTAKENLQIDGSDETAIDELMKELIANHTIG